MILGTFGRIGNGDRLCIGNQLFAQEIAGRCAGAVAVYPTEILIALVAGRSSQDLFNGRAGIIQAGDRIAGEPLHGIDMVFVVESCHKSHFGLVVTYGEVLGTVSKIFVLTVCTT